MLPRYLLLFSFFIISLRILYFVYINLFKNEIKLHSADASPANHRTVSYNRSRTVASRNARSASARTYAAEELRTTNSYASYRARQKR